MYRSLQEPVYPLQLCARRSNTSASNRHICFDPGAERTAPVSLAVVFEQEACSRERRRVKEEA
jgi:hypothetical protein